MPKRDVPDEAVVLARAIALHCAAVFYAGGSAALRDIKSAAESFEVWLLRPEDDFETETLDA